MTLQEQLEQYDIKAGDLIEFADGEIWAKDWEHANLFACIKGESDFGFTTSWRVLEGRTIKRVMRTTWTLDNLYNGVHGITLAELKPKVRKKLVTVEIEGDFKKGEHLGVCVHPTESRWLGKVVEVREK